MAGGGAGELRTAAFYALVDILRVERHKNLPGADMVTDVDSTAVDFACDLKGKIAFIAALDLAGINALGVSAGLTDGQRADEWHVAGCFRFMRNVAVEGEAARKHKHGCTCGEKLLSAAGRCEKLLHYQQLLLEKMLGKYKNL